MNTGKAKKREEIQQKARKQVRSAFQEALKYKPKNDWDCESKHPLFFNNESLGIFGLITFDFGRDLFLNKVEKTIKPEVVKELPVLMRYFGITNASFILELTETSGDDGRPDNWFMRGWITWQDIRIAINYESKKHYSHLAGNWCNNMLEAAFRAVDDCRFHLRFSDMAHRLKKGGEGRFYQLEYLKQD